MLSGTVVTAAGFIPVGFARSSSGEYTNSIFWVVTVALLLSWLVAVIVTPYLGYHLLPRTRRMATGGHDVYDTPVYRRLRRVIEGCVRARWLTIAVTVAAFVAAVIGFGSVPRQFFPSSSRLELRRRHPSGRRLLVRRDRGRGGEDGEAARGARRTSTDWVAYTGAGSPRFFLTFDKQLQNANFAQFVVDERPA